MITSVDTMPCINEDHQRSINHGCDQQKSCVVWESDDQQRSRALVHSRVKRHPSPPSYLSVLAMARTATEVFLVTICAWLELDRSMTSELLYKVEGMSDFLAKIIRHIGYSCLTEHLATVWVLSRRALCIMRGVPIEHTVNITIASLGTISQQPRGFRTLRELDQTTLTLEADLALSVLEEWILACPPNQPLETIVSLTQETVLDIQTIIEDSPSLT